jgi:hypothetical protein
MSRQKQQQTSDQHSLPSYKKYETTVAPYHATPIWLNQNMQSIVNHIGAKMFYFVSVIKSGGNHGFYL